MEKKLMTICLVVLVLCLCGSVQAGTIYVDAYATGANDGSTWADAYNYLQDALGVATSGDEIQVAQGTYKPDEDTANPTGTGERIATFQLINSVTLKGGYGGETILSGDIGIADDNSDNSYHVVIGSGTDATAVLDGFTIKGGNANGPGPSAADTMGGGMLNVEGSPTVTNCTFNDNSAVYNGGGMRNHFYSSPTVTNCVFSGNMARGGGGMYNGDTSSPTVSNCTFGGNSATNGGGMYNWISSPTVTNCIFNGNSTVVYGGGMTNAGESNPTITNCTFHDNSANSYGGGMYNTQDSNPTVTNCILWGDSAPSGPEIFNNYGASATVSYSNVQGGWEGEGNINADPMFVNPSAGDCHLKADSPCIDAGSNDAPALPESDFDGNPRVVDGNDDGTAIVDMGAFEATGGSTPSGTDVVVEPEDPVTGETPVTLTFDEVTEGGVTTVTSTTPSEEQGAPEGFKFGNPPVIYEISTTATFTGEIEVCFDYSSTSYGNESNLRLFHSLDGTNWVDITTSVDTENKIICGTVTSLSFFGAFEPEFVDPIELLEKLVQAVVNLNIEHGVVNGLDAKLDAALSSLDDLNENNDSSAVNKLEAFINSVEQQSGDVIPEGDAEDLIAAAQAIINLLLSE